MPLYYAIIPYENISGIITSSGEFNMKMINSHYKDIHPGYPLDRIAPVEKILFIDIETTGLSRETSNLYLIGCGYFDPDGYHTIQWFGDSPAEESSIIAAFSDHIKGRFTCLVHYNGTRFDIPYLKYKAGLYGIPDPFEALDNFDIYLSVKPYKKLLNLPSLRQRCIEQFLGINSDDPYTGRELIGVYKSYVRSPSDDLLSPLLHHNAEDLKGMAYILPILHYTSLKDATLRYVSHMLHPFNDYEGNPRKELIVNYTHEARIPLGFNTGSGQIRLSMRSDNTALLRLPVIECELKRFYDNYKDYYYLPAEDCCIHRSAASGVSRTHRENAKKETCYTKYSGLFIPSILSDHPAAFRESYVSKDLYLPYTADNADAILSDIGRSIIRYIF